MVYIRVVALSQKKIDFMKENRYPLEGYDHKDVSRARGTYERHLQKLITEKKNTLKKATLPDKIKYVLHVEITLLEQLLAKFNEVY